MNKYLRICIWGVLAIALLFAIAAALASPIAKHIVNTKGEDIIGRKLQVEKVRVNIYTGNVTLIDFQCFEPNGTTNFLYWDRLYLKIAYPRLLGKNVKIKHLHLDGFNAQVLQKKDKLNFSDLIDRFAKDQDDDADERPWKVSLKDIQLSNSGIYYHDVLHNKEWKLENINLAIPGLDFDNEDTNAGLDFSLPTGGDVNVEAKYLAPDNTLRMTFNLHDVHSDAILPIVQDYLNVSSLGASLNGQPRLLTSLDNIQQMEVKGLLTAQGVRVVDYYKNEVARLDELRAVLNRCDLGSRTFVLDSLILSGLTGTYEVHKGWTTKSRLLKSNEPEDSKKIKKTASKKKAQSTKPASKPIIWIARTATLTGHDLVYTDDSERHEWKYAIKTLQANGKNVSSNGRNNVKVNATLTNNAKMKADFTGGLNYRKQNTQFNVTLSNIRLKDFDHLCRNYTGYPLDGGMLYAESHMDISSGRLTGNTRVVIDNPEIGKREKLTKAKYRDLPVRSTFKSLVDSENKVVINAPVNADLTKKNMTLKSAISKSLVKEIFGHMMRTKSKKDQISDNEREAIEALIGDDDDSSRKSATRAKEQKQPEEKNAKEDKKAKRNKRREKSTKK